MKLLLVRHGNTFTANDRVVWCGSQQDLPLTTVGEQQAANVASFLTQKNLIPQIIYTSPLLRTQTTAQLIQQQCKLNIEPIIDRRLNELDYGKWAGLTSNEVIEQYGLEEVTAWNETSLWPQNAGWHEQESDVIARVADFLQFLQSNTTHDSTICVVSSNGILRYFLNAIPNAWQQHITNNTFKMKTGHVSLLCFEQASSHVEFWNQDPRQQS